MEQEKDGRYKTSDLYYAAYLKVAGVDFLGTEVEAPSGRVFFVFDLPTSLSDLKRQYFNRSAKVAALSYADEIKAMKALTHMRG
jgi:hypothetical protein